MNKALRRFSFLVVAATFLLLIAGGLVTSHEAGLAVPDWPLSYGQLFPPMVGNIFWEHGHRMIAATVGLLTLLLVLWTHFKETRKWIRVWAWSALGAVVLQALLGGITVIFLLPAPVSIGHALLGQLFFCLVIGLWYFLNSPRDVLIRGDEANPGFRLSTRVVFFILLIQLLLGAIVRHTGHLIVWHIVMGFILLFVMLRASFYWTNHVNDPIVKKVGITIGLLLIIQIFLGLGAFTFTQMLKAEYAPPLREVLFTSAHHSTGALLLGLTFFLLMKAHHEY